MKWVGHVACMGEMRNVYNILVKKPQGKIPRHRWDEWILGNWGGRVWAGFIQQRIVTSGRIL
jgi:hypothetical protein